MLVYGVSWFDTLFFLVWYRCPIYVAWLLGKFYWDAYIVKPVHYWKYTFMIAAIQVDWTGLEAVPFRYLIRYGNFVFCPKLFLLVCSIWRFCFHVCCLWRGRIQSPVWWSLHPFRILITFLVMLTDCSSNIDLHTASHNFPIEMIDLCERPGSKLFSLTLSSNLGNDSVKYVIDDSLYPHDDETNILWPSFCEFSWGLSGLMYVQGAPVSAIPYFVAISLLWGWLKVFT